MELAKAIDAAQLSRDKARAAAAGIDRTDQRAHHGFAWIATSIAALEAVVGWLDTNGGGILNIFEGAGEIQAQVIARGLLEGHN